MSVLSELPGSTSAPPTPYVHLSAGERIIVNCDVRHVTADEIQN